MNVYYKHGRIYVEMKTGDTLTSQVWVYDRDPCAPVSLATLLRLRFYATRTRQSRRHGWLRATGRYWAIDLDANSTAADTLKPDEVPLPDYVTDAVLKLARSLVTLQERID